MPPHKKLHATLSAGHKKHGEQNTMCSPGGNWSPGSTNTRNVAVHNPRTLLMCQAPQVSGLTWAKQTWQCTMQCAHPQGTAFLIPPGLVIASITPIYTLIKVTFWVKYFQWLFLPWTRSILRASVIIWLCLYANAKHSDLKTLKPLPPVTT